MEIGNSVWLECRPGREIIKNVLETLLLSRDDLPQLIQQQLCVWVTIFSSSIYTNILQQYYGNSNSKDGYADMFKTIFLGVKNSIKNTNSFKIYFTTDVEGTYFDRLIELYSSGLKLDPSDLEKLMKPSTPTTTGVVVRGGGVAGRTMKKKKKLKKKKKSTNAKKKRKK